MRPARQAGASTVPTQPQREAAVGCHALHGGPRHEEGPHRESRSVARGWAVHRLQRAPRDADPLPPRGDPRVGGGRLVRRLVATAQATGAWHDARVRQEVMCLYVEERALELTNVRIAGERRAGRTPAAASVTKLARSVLTRRIEDTGTRLHGPAATSWQMPTDPGAVAADAFLQAQCATIVGGTSDIQRTLIGERTLGLPREPSVTRANK